MALRESKKEQKSKEERRARKGGEGDSEGQLPRHKVSHRVRRKEGHTEKRKVKIPKTSVVKEKGDH